MLWSPGMTSSVQSAVAEPFSAYLEDLRELHVLDAQTELAQTRTLIALRRACWCAALEDRATLRSVCDGMSAFDDVDWGLDALIDALLEADPDRAALDAMLRSPLTTAHTRTRLLDARAAYRKHRNRFMSANLRLVIYVAKRHGRHRLPLGDRVQEGNLGLLKAIDRFDPERGFRFSTYAAWWVRHMVTHALTTHGRTVRVPAHVHRMFTKMRMAKPALEAKLGRAATDEDFANHLGVSQARIRWTRDAMQMNAVSLDVPANNDGQPLGATLEDDGGDEWAYRIEARLDARLARRLVDGLDAKAPDIVTHRFGLDDAPRTTLRELGKRYGVSRERVRQLQNRALDQLRTLLDGARQPLLASNCAR